MRRWVLAIALSLIAIVPAAAQAAATSAPAQQTTPYEPGAPGFNGDKALVIAAGLVIGAAVGSVLTFRGATIVGAVAGGVIAGWWYGDRSDIARLRPR
ncbi:MAG TPA: hypothetical protein VGR91_07125 [Stellaceae bacterium]|nr:hypothetical protein [Stellaceae bacterium]